MEWLMSRLNLLIGDWKLLVLMLLVLVCLIAGTVVGRMLEATAGRDPRRFAMVANFQVRVRSWWVMATIFAIAVLTGEIGAILLFTCCSFLALREFVCIVPTRRADHRTLVWCFWVVLPLQYWFIYIGWYGMFVLLIPLYAFLFIPMRNVLAGDCEHFLERTAKIQWGITSCIYCISYTPMLLKLACNFGDDVVAPTANARLLWFLVMVVEMSDVFQYCWGKSIGRHKLLPTVSPNKTMEGLVGGVLSATILGGMLSVFTPLSFWQGTWIALLVALAGFAGDVTMSAIKRDSGVKDYGTMLAGHGGMLDRLDSLCFAAPVFFHIIRYFFVA